MQNAKGRGTRTIMFDNAKELVAGRTDEFCEQQGIRIISSLTHRHRMESPNDSVGVATNVIHAARHELPTALLG